MTTQWFAHIVVMCVVLYVVVLCAHKVVLCAVEFGGGCYNLQNTVIMLLFHFVSVYIRFGFEFAFSHILPYSKIPTEGNTG